MIDAHPLSRPGNDGAPYTWTEDALWDRARALGLTGRSGLSREALAALVASLTSKGG
jgi:hypothetical protein